jgi:hypothetical protein
MMHAIVLWGICMHRYIACSVVAMHQDMPRYVEWHAHLKTGNLCSKWHSKSKGRSHLGKGVALVSKSTERTSVERQRPLIVLHELCQVEESCNDFRWDGWTSKGSLEAAYESSLVHFVNVQPAGHKTWTVCICERCEPAGDSMNDMWQSSNICCKADKIVRGATCARASLADGKQQQRHLSDSMKPPFEPMRVSAGRAKGHTYGEQLTSHVGLHKGKLVAGAQGRGGGVGE